MRAIALFFVFVMLAGCGQKRIPSPQIVKVVETVEVKVPVLVQRMPPPELLAPLAPPLPMFVAPSDPLASSALTIEGERLLRGMLEDLRRRIDEWKVWATTTEPAP